ncbi:MAG: T9SS type A sorting domain-containing protein [Bacteroidetes bacterium]|nr:T9SS type A sorting domain-containing protein [Bacteroidota bacterium]
MTKLLTLLLSFSLVHSALAQVSLDASMTPALGKIIFYDANVPSPTFTFGKKGQSNTWDFTAISPLPTESDTIYIKDASDFPGLTDYIPSVTHVFNEYGEPENHFVQIDNKGVKSLGLIGDLYGTGQPLMAFAPKPLTTMQFPYKYGSSNASDNKGIVKIVASGSAVGVPLADSILFMRYITNDRKVIAEGNMIIPSGTFAAILERSINTQVDSAWFKSVATGGNWAPAPGFPKTSIDSSFNWYTENSLYKYAHALYDNTGLHDVVFFKDRVVGTQEPVVEEESSVYPNPVVDLLHIRCSLTENGSAALAVFDLQGNMVIETGTTGTKLDVSQMLPGIYFLRISPMGTAPSYHRFVKI